MQDFSEMLINSSVDGILAFDRDCRYTIWNPAMERISGISRSEVLGKCAFDLFPFLKETGEDQFFFEALAGKSVISTDRPYRVPESGRQGFFEGHYSPIFSESGEIIGGFAIIRDITDRKHSEEEHALLAREQVARAEAEQASRMKDEFLATVSHELRTPLNSILAWVHLLKSGKLDQTAFARAIETIERNAKSQAQLIEDLLDISRIITGKIRIHVKPVELEPIINAALDAVRLAADAKAIQLRTSFDPMMGFVTGDPARLQQVVWNLLSNAIKFTPPGGRVEIRLAQVDSHAQITVSDTGSGINKELLPHVFERFRQGDGATTRKHGGLGLGLAIVRHVVEMHGGTVRADSRGEGLGATFTIDLPLLMNRM